LCSEPKPQSPQAQLASDLPYFKGSTDHADEVVDKAFVWLAGEIRTPPARRLKELEHESRRFKRRVT
jgi:hypothetical protein